VKALLLALEGLTAPALRKALDDHALPSLREITAQGITELRFPLAESRLAMLVSAMTGAWPDQHGILTVARGDAASETLRLVNGCDLAQPTLWEALDPLGVPCLSVGWPLSINGKTANASIVSSDFGETTGAGIAPDPEAFIHPGALAQGLGWLWLRPEELDPSSLSALAPKWGTVDCAADNRPGLLATTVAGNVSRHAAFLELLGSDDWDLATLLMSLPAELSSLERASDGMKDGLLEGLSDRAMPLINALIVAILEKIPDGTNLIIAGIPHSERPAEPGFVAVAGPAFAPDSFPGMLDITELAPLAWACCGFLREGFLPRGIAPLKQDLQRIPPNTQSHGHASLLGTETDLRHASEKPLSPFEQWRVESLALLTRSFMARGKWAEAIPALESQVRMLPLHQEAYLLLSECRQRSGLLEEALDAAYAAIHPVHGGDPVALLRAAELEALCSRPEKARALLGQASPAVKSFPHRRILQANVLIFLREWPEAEELLRNIDAETPGNAYVLYRLSRCLVARRHWQGAFDLAVESLRLEPSSALVHELLGHALHGMGMLEQARTAFGNASALDPRWSRPKAMLVTIARRMKRPKEEIDLLHEAYLQSKGTLIPISPINFPFRRFHMERRIFFEQECPP